MSVLDSPGLDFETTLPFYENITRDSYANKVTRTLIAHISVTPLYQLRQ